MNVVVLGCGRVGSAFARQMYKDGHTVTIIDLQSEAFRRLGIKFKGVRIVGNGIDEDVLRRAGIRVTGRVRTAGVTPALPGERIAVIESPPLWQLLSVVLKPSQNLYAEMLFKRGF